MQVHFVYPSWDRPSDNHSVLREVEAFPYIGTPSMGAASIAAMTPPGFEISFQDDRVEPVTPAPGPDIIAIPTFTPAADRAMEIADGYRELGIPVLAGGIFTSLMPEAMLEHVDAVCIGEGEPVWAEMLTDPTDRTLNRPHKPT